VLDGLDNEGKTVISEPDAEEQDETDQKSEGHPNLSSE